MVNWLWAGPVARQYTMMGVHGRRSSSTLWPGSERERDQSPMTPLRKCL
jgi:hypothetical protein